MFGQSDCQTVRLCSALWFTSCTRNSRLQPGPHFTSLHFTPHFFIKTHRWPGDVSLSLSLWELRSQEISDSVVWQYSATRCVRGRLRLVITVSGRERWWEESVTTVRVPLIQTEHGQVGHRLCTPLYTPLYTTPPPHSSSHHNIIYHHTTPHHTTPHHCNITERLKRRGEKKTPQPRPGQASPGSRDWEVAGPAPVLMSVVAPGGDCGQVVVGAGLDCRKYSPATNPSLAGTEVHHGDLPGQWSVRRLANISRTQETPADLRDQTRTIKVLLFVLYLKYELWSGISCLAIWMRHCSDKKRTIKLINRNSNPPPAIFTYHSHHQPNISQQLCYISGSLRLNW